MLTTSMDFENPDLRRFLSDDDEVSARGFEALAPKMRTFLRPKLRGMLKVDADLEDAVEEAILKIWKARKRFNPTSEDAWWGYVRIIGWHCAYDIIRRKRGDDPQEMLDVPSKDLPVVDIVMELIEKERLYQAADELWLDVPATLSPKERDARLLAAQFFYLDDRPWSEICSLLGAHVKVERSDLDSWLSSPYVLLSMAFSQLYMSNGSLWNRLKQTLTAEPWTQEQAKAFELRYRFARLTDQISRDTKIDSESLNQWFEESARHLPFQGQAEALNAIFRRNGLDPELLKKDSLWRRIAFQYHADDELPHKHILERGEKAGACVGFQLTAAKLNAWLSNGRLFVQLARYVQGEPT